MIEEITNELGSTFIVISKEDGSTTWIPKDLSNSDYQRYLNPKAEQSTPILPE
jgi:hypothetical protein